MAATMGSAAYRRSATDIDYSLAMPDNFRYLPHSAYEVRSMGLPQMLGFARRVKQMILADVSRYEADQRIHQAEALHLIAFTLSNELKDAGELLSLLEEPVGKLEWLALAKGGATLGCYNARCRWRTASSTTTRTRTARSSARTRRSAWAS
jgi:hypothetical protein